MTKRVAKSGHAVEPIKKPCTLHRFFWSFSSVFWLRLSSSPHRSTPSLGQGAAEGVGVGDRAVGRWKAGRRKVGGGEWMEGEGGGEGREWG